MKKAKYIDPKDLENLQYDEKGNIIIPEGFEIYTKEDPEAKRQERIEELEKELLNWDESTDEELIEEGKFTHPYYMILRDLEMLKKGLR